VTLLSLEAALCDLLKMLSERGGVVTVYLPVVDHQEDCPDSERCQHKQVAQCLGSTTIDSSKTPTIFRCSS
jgi:hypothetical protein